MISSINEAHEDVRDIGRCPGAHRCADQLLVELAIKLKYVVFEHEVKELQDEVSGHQLVHTGLQGLPYSLHPVLPLDVGVEGGHVDGVVDGAI